MSIVLFDSSVSEFVVDSLTIAESLGKPHHSIMRILSKLESTVGTTSSRNIFVSSDYVDSRNKTQPKYLLTQKGVILLMSRMQDQIEWFLKLSDTFDKLQKELIKKNTTNKLNGLSKEQNVLPPWKEGKEKHINEYGSTYSKHVPQDKKCFIPFKDVLSKHGIPFEGGNQIPADLVSDIAAVDLMVKAAESKAEGMEKSVTRYRLWQKACHLRFKQNKSLPSPKDFHIKTTFKRFDI